MTEDCECTPKRPINRKHRAMQRAKAHAPKYVSPEEIERRRVANERFAKELSESAKAWRSIVEDDIPYPRNHDWRDELPL